MIIYRLNQTPDKLYTQFLNLLGVRPFPARAATADLTFWLSATTDQVGRRWRRAPSSRASTPRRRRTARVEFATTADLRIEQPTLTAALTGHGETGLVDVLDDLRYDREAGQGVRLDRSPRPATASTSASPTRSPATCCSST